MTNAERIRAFVRPVCIVLLCTTLCVSVIIGQCGFADTPTWFIGLVATPLVEWFFERAVTSKTRNKVNEGTT